MPYDEALAERIRALLDDEPNVDERRMFGGLAFLVRGHMFVGVISGRLVARVGPEAAARALARRHVRPMDFTGRPLKGYVYVEAAGLKRRSELRRWLDAALRFVETLPPKN